MTVRHLNSRMASLSLACLCITAPAAGQTITEIIDTTGDGGGNQFSAPQAIAVADDGTVYVASGFDIAGPDFPHRIFKIETDGVVTLLFDGSDGTCLLPTGFAIDDSENVYIACCGSDNVIKIEPGGSVTEIIDNTEINSCPRDIAVDASGNVYVAEDGIGGFGFAHRITPGGMVTMIFPDTNNPFNLGLLSGIAVDSSQNVYVSGNGAPNSNRVAKIDPAGNATVIATETGDGDDSINDLRDIALDSAGNVYIAGGEGDNAFKITPGGVITEIIDTNGDGIMGNFLQSAVGIAVDGNGSAYVTGFLTDNAFCIAPDGTISQIIDATGDGAGNILERADKIAVDVAGNVFVTGLVSNNAFKIELPSSGPVPTTSKWGLIAMCLLILTAGTLLHARRTAAFT